MIVGESKEGPSKREKEGCTNGGKRNERPPGEEWKVDEAHSALTGGEEKLQVWLRAPFIQLVSAAYGSYWIFSLTF